MSVTTEVHPAVNLHHEGRSKAEIGYALDLSYAQVTEVLRGAGIVKKLRRLPPDAELLAMAESQRVGEIAQRYAVSPASVSAAIKRARARAAV